MADITTPFVYVGVVVTLAAGTVCATVLMVWATNWFWRRLRSAYDLMLLARVMCRLARRGLIKGDYGQ